MVMSVSGVRRAATTKRARSRRKPWCSTYIMVRSAGPSGAAAWPGRSTAFIAAPPRRRAGGSSSTTGRARRSATSARRYDGVSSGAKGRSIPPTRSRVVVRTLAPLVVQRHDHAEPGDVDRGVAAGVRRAQLAGLLDHGRGDEGEAGEAELLDESLADGGATGRCAGEPAGRATSRGGRCPSRGRRRPRRLAGRWTVMDDSRVVARMCGVVMSRTITRVLAGPPLGPRSQSTPRARPAVGRSLEPITDTVSRKRTHHVPLHHTTTRSGSRRSPAAPAGAPSGLAGTAAPATAAGDGGEHPPPPIDVFASDPAEPLYGEPVTFSVRTSAEARASVFHGEARLAGPVDILGPTPFSIPTTGRFFAGTTYTLTVSAASDEKLRASTPSASPRSTSRAR